MSPGKGHICLQDHQGRNGNNTNKFLKSPKWGGGSPSLLRMPFDVRLPKGEKEPSEVPV